MKRCGIALCLSMLLAGCNALTSQMEKNRNDAYDEWAASRVQVYEELAQSHYASGDLARAREKAEEALKLQPQNTKLRLLLSRVCIEQEDYRAALVNLKQLKDEAPLYEQAKDKAQAWEVSYYSGVAYERTGQLSTALDCFQEAWRQDSHQPGPVLAATEVLVRMGRIDEAQAFLETRIDPMGNDAAAAELAGRIAMMRSQYPLASRYFHHAHDLDPKSCAYQRMLAEALYRSGSLAEAGRVLDGLLANSEYKPAACVLAMQGDCKVSQGRIAEAVGAYRQATEVDPGNARLHLALARTLIQAKDWPGAVRAASRAQSIEPGKVETALVLAYAMLEHGQTDTAINVLERARQLHRKDAVLLCLLGRAYAKDGRNRLATACYNQAIQIEPRNVLARELLAQASR